MTDTTMAVGASAPTERAAAPIATVAPTAPTLAPTAAQLAPPTEPAPGGGNAPTLANVAPPTAPPGPNAAADPNAPKKAIEKWQSDLAVETWLALFAQVHERWAAGREVTEAEYRAGLQRAFDAAFR